MRKDREQKKDNIYEYHEEGGKRSLMKLNRFISKPQTLFVILSIIDLIGIFLTTYIINFLRNILFVFQGNATKEFLKSLWKIDWNYITTGGYKVYLVVIAILIIWDMIFVYRVRVAYSNKAINYGQKGANRWTTKKEIKQQYLEIEPTKKEYKGYPGILISEFDGKTYIDTSFCNNLYYAITRGGKDETQVARNEDIYSRAEIKPSIVELDPKAEAFKRAKTILEKRGYIVHFMNLENPELSMGFNPCELIVKTWKKGDITHAEDLTNSLAFSLFNPEQAQGNEGYFKGVAANVFVAMVIAMTEDAIKEDEQNGTDCEWRKVSIYNILMLAMELMQISIMATDPVTGEQYDTGKTALDEFFELRPINDRARFKYFTLSSAKSQKTIGNVISTFTRVLDIFSYTSVAKMTAESSFDLSELGFGDKPIAVFIGAPEYDQSKNVLASIFIKQAYFANAEACWNIGVCKRPIRFECNELGNFPEIPDLTTMLSVGLGRHISFNIYIQSDEQLTDVYRSEKAKIIKANCANKIFILSDEEETCKMFSNLIGERTVTDVQRSGSKLSLDKHYMESTISEPLIRPTALTKLHMGECIIHRISKRTDNDGNDVIQTPIFNRVSEGMRISARYQILEDDFPSPATIDLSKINHETRNHINIEELMWDKEVSFKLLNDNKEKNIAAPKADIPVSAIENENPNNRKLYQLSDRIKNMLLSFLQEIYGDNVDIQMIENMTVAGIIDEINETDSFNETEKKSILDLLNKELNKGTDK